MLRSQREIEEGLLSQLSEARAALDSAIQRRQELNRLYASEGRIADGVVTLREAEYLHRYAFWRYRLAFRRLSTYLALGELPEP